MRALIVSATRAARSNRRNVGRGRNLAFVSRVRASTRASGRAREDDARDERAAHRLVRRARRVSLRRGVGVGIERGRRARDEGRWKYRIALLVAREI